MFPNLNSSSIDENARLVKIVSMNLGTDPNSTVIEHKLHEALFGENIWK